MGIDLNRFRGRRNQEWLDWLQDDPVPASLRGRMRERAVRAASRPVVRDQSRPVDTAQQTPPKSSAPKTVSIHLALPDTTRLKAKLSQARSLASKHRPPRYAVIGVGAVFIVGGGVLGALQISNKGKNPEAGGTEVLSQNTQKPDFEYSLPKGDESELVGDVRYDAEKKVVNYQDSIGGVSITISQQPLPEGFKQDTEAKVKKLAADFAATEELVTANPTAYIGTSVKGPQTVVFAKKDLLVFIQSIKEIDDKDWAEYVTNLK